MIITIITNVQHALCNLQVVFITGANSGIGECLAKYFYKAGCRLILAARRKNELERARDTLVRMQTVWKIKIHIVNLAHCPVQFN